MVFCCVKIIKLVENANSGITLLPTLTISQGYPGCASRSIHVLTANSHNSTHLHREEKVEMRKGKFLVPSTTHTAVKSFPFFGG